MTLLRVDALGALNDETEEVQVSDAVTGQIGFQIEGTFVGTITIYGTLHDGTSPTWVAIQAVNRADGVAATTIAAAAILVVDAAGLLKVKLEMTAYTSGTANVRKLPHIG